MVASFESFSESVGISNLLNSESNLLNSESTFCFSSGMNSALGSKVQVEAEVGWEGHPWIPLNPSLTSNQG